MNFLKKERLAFKNKKIIIPLTMALVLGIGIFYFRPDSSKTALVEIGRDENFNPIIIGYDLKYSFKDYTNQNLRDVKDLNGKTIYASVFMQEIPDIPRATGSLGLAHIFPEDMKGVTFVNSNLDNVFIPEGNTVIGGSHKRFKVQNDLRDWLIDENNKPIEVLNKEFWESQGYSVDPKDIPNKPLKDISEIKKVK